MKDQLTSYFHWNDRQGLDQAVDICLECSVELKEIKDWSLREGFFDKFRGFITLLKKNQLENRREK